MNSELEKYITTWEEYPKLEWLEHLIWCPSQISYRFCYEGIRCEMYLRWRFKDPWTFTVIVYPPNSEDPEDSDWYEVTDFPEFTALDYEDAKVWCEEWLLKQLHKKEFNKYLEHGKVF